MPAKGNKGHKARCERYRNQNSYAKNKVTKLTRVLSMNPNDKMAAASLAKYEKELGIKR